MNIYSSNQIKQLLPDAIIRSGTIIYKGVKIGKNFTTGHNAIIREGNILGENVLVGTNSYLGPGNIIGNNVRIHTSCFVESVVLEDNVIIAPNVVFTNDPHPICRICMEKAGKTIVGKNSAVGANATILPGIKIGKNCLIGAGSVVTKNVLDNTIVVGNPAKFLKKNIHSHK